MAAEELDLSGEDALVLVEKRRVVRAIAQCPDAQLGTVAQLLAFFRRPGTRDASHLSTLPNRHVLLGIGDLSLHVIDQALQRM